MIDTGRADQAPQARPTRPMRARFRATGLYSPDVTSTFLAVSFFSVLSPTETVRMPSR
jgi:hypothetical protein